MRLLLEDRKIKWALGGLLTILCPLSCWWLGYSMKAGLVLMAAAAGVTAFRFRITDTRLLTAVYVVLFPAVSFIGIIVGMITQNLSLFRITVELLLINTALHMSFQLLFLLMGMRCRASAVGGFLIPFGCMLANAYVHHFRGNSLTPFDLLSVQTAANVAAEYDFTPPSTILYGLLAATILVLALYCVPELQPTRSVRSKLLQICAALACVGVVCFNTTRYTMLNWSNEGAERNGYLFNFLLQLKGINVTEPEKYGHEAVEALEGAYAQESGPQSRPDIIVIMDESFADFRVFGNENPAYAVTPYIDSMSDDTVRGYLCASVFGGSTANSEYEFLSGSTMAFLPQGSMVYQQYYSEDSWTLVSYMKALGYDCIAMHPYHANGWMRDKVYPQMGFDRFLSLEDFPQEQMLREYVSDQEMFEQIIALHESHSAETPLFLFGITMQNHGGYAYEGPDFQETVALPEYPMAQQYLTLARETDRAVEFLIEHYRNVERDTVIVFFGDHMPNVESAFYENANGGSFDTLDQQMKKQMVPFFVWANFDIEERQIPCSSINYLPLYTLEAAGLPLPPYMQFLKDTEAVIPAINAYGYYSAQEQCFLPLEDASGAEADAIRAYEYLQYNNMFDSEHRSEHFFGNEP